MNGIYPSVPSLLDFLLEGGVPFDTVTRTTHPTMASFNPPRRAKRPLPPELLASASEEDALEAIEDEFHDDLDGSVFPSFFLTPALVLIDQFSAERDSHDLLTLLLNVLELLEGGRLMLMVLRMELGMGRRKGTSHVRRGNTLDALIIPKSRRGGG